MGESPLWPWRWGPTPSTCSWLKGSKQDRRLPGDENSMDHLLYHFLRVWTTIFQWILRWYPRAPGHWWLEWFTTWNMYRYIHIYIYIHIFLPVVNTTHNFHDRPNQTCIGTIGVPLKQTRLNILVFSGIFQVLSPIATPRHQQMRNLWIINHRSTHIDMTSLIVLIKWHKTTISTIFK